MARRSWHPPHHRAPYHRAPAKPPRANGPPQPSLGRKAQELWNETRQAPTAQVKAPPPVRQKRSRQSRGVSAMTI